MKLIELLQITELNKEAPFITYKYDNGEKDTLTIKQDGIYFWQEASIDSFGNFDSKEHQYKISRFIEKNINVNSAQQQIYYAVCSVLHNIGLWKEVDVEEFVLANLKACVDRLTQEIKDNLDFSQVKEMGTLIRIISEDKFYQQLVFNVTEYSFQKKMFGYYATSRKPQRYSFGNIKYYEDLKKVDITVYQDYVELNYCSTGSSFERQHDSGRAELTIESKIIAALDNWHCYYTN